MGRVADKAKRSLHELVKWIARSVREKFRIDSPDLPYYVTILVAFVLFVAALNGFVELTEELAERELGTFDKKVSEFIRSYQSPGLTLYFSFVTHFGERLPYILISGLLAIIIYFRYRSLRFIFQTVVVLLLSSLTNIVLKRVIGRGRPDLEQLVSVDSSSYPSGHSMSAMAFYGFLIYLCFELEMPGWTRWLLVFISALIILSVGISRIYLGVHFPSDVVAGFVGGLIWVSFCIVLFNLIALLRHRNDLKRS